jgi:hypothetical protein
MICKVYSHPHQIHNSFSIGKKQKALPSSPTFSCSMEPNPQPLMKKMVGHLDWAIPQW